MISFLPRKGKMFASSCDVTSTKNNPRQTAYPLERSQAVSKRFDIADFLLIFTEHLHIMQPFY